MKNSFKKLAVVFLSVLTCLSSQAQTITYIHNDIVGSPVMATDDSGNTLWKENYRPYGEKILNAAANNDEKLGFVSKPYDPVTGLSYMGARYYDPVIGRFLSTDPVGISTSNLHSFNRYAYANNNPYRYVDPDGRIALPAFVVLTGATIAWFIYSQTPEVKRAQQESFARAVRAASNVFRSDSVESGNESKAESGKRDQKNPGRAGSGFPDRELPRTPDGDPIRDPEAEGAHSQLGQRQGRREKHDQAREWGADGRPVRDIDFTDHGRPQNHTNPHEHRYVPNPTGGTPQRGNPTPLK